ncbi:hypothetical protein [Streptomyces sp. NBC_00212]|uniref:hypothetical protein n=1 Tax=Streptomyces sp. NBC_00212 TaxID=2975684 RepID=UPI002F906C8F
MMQHARALVQEISTPPRTADRPQRLAPDAFVLIREHTQQELGTTASRRTRRADFLRAAAWAITARLHPKATGTTLRVAQDLSARLNADGHVAYCRDAMFRRLHISRRTLERHMAVLRELGLLVWAVHGSRTNTRPTGSGEWAGTATIYAAVVPRAWDETFGHRLSGHGYHARHVGFTVRGRELAIADARRRARPSTRRRDTPSCKTNHPRRTAEVEGKKNNTSRRRGRPRKSHPICVPETYRAEPQQAAHAMSVAAWVRPRVPWTQGEGLRRLAFALRPWVASGHSAADIAADFSVWRVTRRLASPAALIMARWREREHHPLLDDVPDREPSLVTVPPNRVFLEAMEQLRASLPTARAPAELAPPDPPGFVIRDRILASFREADRARRACTAEQCVTFAEWEAACDERERAPR